MRIISCSKNASTRQTKQQPLSLVTLHAELMCKLKYIQAKTPNMSKTCGWKPAVAAAARKGGDLQRGPERLLGAAGQALAGCREQPALALLSSVQCFRVAHHKTAAGQSPETSPRCASGLLKASLPFAKSPVPGPQQHQKGRILLSFFSLPTSTTILPQVWLL